MFAERKIGICFDNSSIDIFSFFSFSSFICAPKYFRVLDTFTIPSSLKNLFISPIMYATANVDSVTLYEKSNFFIAFIHRKYPYEKKEFQNAKPLSFSLTITKSLKRSIDTLFLVLGTILFYFILQLYLLFFVFTTLLTIICK